jgi:hypothetical protein
VFRQNAFSRPTDLISHPIAVIKAINCQNPLNGRRQITTGIHQVERVITTRQTTQLASHPTERATGYGSEPLENSFNLFFNRLEVDKGNRFISTAPGEKWNSMEPELSDLLTQDLAVGRT